MFGALESDSDEKNNPREKRERSDAESGNNADNESDTTSVLKRPRIEEESGNNADDENYSEPMGKKKRKEKHATLTTKKRKLFKKVCSGLDPNFKTEMQRKNSNYIERLSDEIDDYIDSLVQTNYEKKTDLLQLGMLEIKRDLVCTDLMKKQCDLESNMLNDKGCVRLPGYYEKEDPKQFIPQLYHILQDYGFFYHYLEFPMMDEKLSNSRILARWALNLGKILGRLNSSTNQYRFITVMLLRLRRVQFMRAFDVKCCLGSVSDEGHMGFNGVLQDVYDTLLDERAKIIRSNPHTDFCFLPVQKHAYLKFM